MSQPRSFGMMTLWPRLEIGKSSLKPCSRPSRIACPYEIGKAARLGDRAPRARVGRTEPGEDEAREPEEERRDAVLDVVVARALLVPREPRGQRVRRLDPVDERERDQRDAENDGKPNEKTAALHRGRSLRVLQGRCGSTVTGTATNKALERPETAASLAMPPKRPPDSLRAAANPAGARTISVQYERATREPLFRSPSRFRFRPPAPMTFGFRLLPSLPASTYLRSVLGAKRNLGEVKAVGKRSEFEKDAICTDSIIHISTADLAACGNVPE